MKTALVFTCYLDSEENYKKSVKFVNHYKKFIKYDIIGLDNNSSAETIKRFQDETNIVIISFDKHLPRDSHLSYPYLWRAVYYLKELLKGYQKIVYMDNDFYVLSGTLMKYVDNLDSGWTTFWCARHQFPETGCHIIVKGCKEYDNFVASNDFMEHNGKTMEKVLPVTKVEKGFIGDRYGEMEKPPLSIEVDFWAQAKLEDKF